MTSMTSYIAFIVAWVHLQERGRSGWTRRIRGRAGGGETVATCADASSERGGGAAAEAARVVVRRA